MTADQAATVQAYASIAGVGVTALGLIAIFAQIRGASRVSQRQNASMFLLGDHRKLLKEEADRALEGIFDLFSEEQMSDSVATQIIEDAPKSARLDALLNHYETIAAGIRAGAFDEEMFRFAYFRPVRVLCWQLIRYFRQVRKQARNDKIFSEIEQLAARWDRWSDAAPHYFRDGEVIVGVPYKDLPMPTDKERSRHRMLKR